MNILFVTCAFPPYHGGGVSVLLEDLSQQFINNGNKVYVFSLQDNNNLEAYKIKHLKHKGVECIFINLPGSTTNFFNRYLKNDYYNAKNAKILDQYINQIKPDIVHFHAIQALGANLVDTVKKHKVKTILTMHDFWWFCPNLFLVDFNYNDCCPVNGSVEHVYEQVKKIQPNIELTKEDLEHRNRYLREQLDKFDIVLGNSKFLVEKVKTFGFDKIILNENGVTISKNISTQKRNNSSKIIFGFLGGRNDMKGYHIIKEAFDNIRDNDLELHVYGIPVRSLKENFLTFLHHLKFNNFKDFINLIVKRVKFTKDLVTSSNIKYFPEFKVENKYKVYSTFDVILVGSCVIESFSLVAREAQAMGIPVLSSNCGGPTDIIKHNVNGIFYNRNSPKDLVEKIIECKEKIHELKKHSTLTKVHYVDSQAKELMQLYQS